MLKILGRGNSINVRKVLWTCAEIGLAFEQEAWGRGFRPTSDPEFLALNPNGLVPVIRDGDTVLWESNTIIRYLAAKAGRTDLLPADPGGRAAIEQWMDWQSGSLNEAWRYAVYALVRKVEGFDDAAQIAASLKSWRRHMRILEGQFAAQAAAGRHYAAGTGFTLADIVLGLSVARWFEAPIERVDLPAVQAYFARLRERNAFCKYESDH